MSDEFKVIILATFDRNDFPNKAMSDIHGKPMIQHVFESAKKSAASEIVIATDNTRVGMAAEEFGATVCMIIDEDVSGISRLAEVADKMAWGDDAVVVNFPADAPLTPGSVIQQVAENLITQTEADCAILYSMVSRQQAEKDYTINLVVDSADKVMYFSRLPLPHEYSADFEVSEYKSSIEINAYRCGLLRIYRNLPESELDKAEAIEELKLLYNGMTIHAAEANSLIGQRVITQEHIAKVKFLIAPE